MGSRLAACLLAALVAHAAAAQDDPSEAQAEGESPTATLHGRLKLSIEEALAMGLRNNLNVEVARHNPLIAWEDFRIAWGAYDPESFAEFGYDSTKTPVASILQPGSDELVQRTVGGQTGVRGQIPWLNSSYGLVYEGDRLKTNSRISDLSPEFEASVTATLTQPLLRNLIWNASWTRIKTSQIGYDASVDQFSRQVMDTVAEIELAYWLVVANEEQLRVAEKSLEAAEALLDQTKTQYEVGVVSRVEVVQAEAGVAQREFDRIVAQNAYDDAQDELLREVLGRDLAPGSQIEVEPTDRPQDYVVYEIDVEAAAAKAFTNRPELATARKEIETRIIERKFARNQRLPQLDIEGGVGYQGLAGRSNPAAGSPPVRVGPRYRNTDDDFVDGDPQFWSLKGIFSIPLGNMVARHRATQADIEVRRAHSQLRRLEEDIIVEVRTAARDLEAAQEGIEAAERNRIATEEQLRAERIRLEQGESTPFDVLQREEDLVRAESEKIRAVQIYRNSIVALDREQGTILQSRNILIDDVRGMR